MLRHKSNRERLATKKYCLRGRYRVCIIASTATAVVLGPDSCSNRYIADTRPSRLESRENDDPLGTEIPKRETYARNTELSC